MQLCTGVYIVMHIVMWLVLPRFDTNSNKCPLTLSLSCTLSCDKRFHYVQHYSMLDNNQWKSLPTFTLSSSLSCDQGLRDSTLIRTTVLQTFTLSCTLFCDMCFRYSTLVRDTVLQHSHCHAHCQGISASDILDTYIHIVKLIVMRSGHPGFNSDPYDCFTDIHIVMHIVLWWVLPILDAGPWHCLPTFTLSCTLSYRHSHCHAHCQGISTPDILDTAP
jgi:hypothetical protein